MGCDGKAARRRRAGLAVAACWLFVHAGILPGSLGENRAEKTEAPAAQDRLRSLRVDGFFDPLRGFIAATARLRFDEVAGEKPLWLANELKLNEVRGGSVARAPFSSESGQFAVQCPAAGEMEFDYSGQLAFKANPFNAIAGADQNPGTDECRFLSYIMDYYPHPQDDFAAMEMRIRVPAAWSCLGSGTLVSLNRSGAESEYLFRHPESKGISLVFGRFRQLRLLPGAVPIRLHGWPGFQFRKYYDEAELVRLLSFYLERFGPLPVPELSILFRRGAGFMGVSYSGLIVLHVDGSGSNAPFLQREKVWAESLMEMADPATDVLVHEMAHQWWGGVVSWKTPADNWITEGLATYSSLLYLRQRQGEKSFRRACKAFRSRVKRYARDGVPADGAVLKLRCRDARAYQALVYLKPALMLAELADAVGEAEVCRRLRAILESCHGRGLEGDRFLDLLGAGDPFLRQRLGEWIHQRGLPQERLALPEVNS